MKQTERGHDSKENSNCQEAVLRFLELQTLCFRVHYGMKIYCFWGQRWKKWGAHVFFKLFPTNPHSVHLKPTVLQTTSPEVIHYILSQSQQALYQSNINSVKPGCKWARVWLLLWLPWEFWEVWLVIFGYMLNKSTWQKEAGPLSQNKCNISKPCLDSGSWQKYDVTQGMALQSKPREWH